jgi:putative ABC transport system ATP-binding protein
LPESGKRSVVVVTHDPGAVDYGDRIVQLRDGLVEVDRRLRQPSSGGDGRTTETRISV